MNSDKAPSASRWIISAVAFALLFVAGMTAGYFFYKKGVLTERTEESGAVLSPGDGAASLRVYYPVEGRLQLEYRKVQQAATRMSIARAALGEFLKGPSGAQKSYIPRDTRLLGVYSGQDGILYVDLSDEFRRNFQGDALAEFLLLRGLYGSLLSNVYGIGGVKILVEGKEVESIGGHVSLLRPLEEVVSQPMEEDESQ